MSLNLNSKDVGTSSAGSENRCQLTALGMKSKEAIKEARKIARREEQERKQAEADAKS